MRLKSKIPVTSVIPAIIFLGSVGASAQTDNASALSETKPALQLISGPRFAFSAIVHEGHSLTGDHRGRYQDASNDSSVYNRDALNLFVWAYVEQRNNKPNPKRPAPRNRYMTFDLSRPVDGSGAMRLPICRDYLARFHAFWKFDDPKPGTSVVKLHLVTDIPIGATVESERVEMWVLIDGVQHVLQMGPWAIGKFSARATIDGRGTTKATITRHTDDSWRIKASEGSIARLWDYSDIQHPVDKGLYFFSFDVEFTKLR